MAACGGRRDCDRLEIRLAHRRQAHLESGRFRHRGAAIDLERRLDLARTMGLAGPVRNAARLLRHPGAACCTPLRHGAVLPWQPCGAVVRARLVARRSGHHPDPSAAKRLAPDLHVLHDLRSAHLARCAAGPLPVRGFGRSPRPLSCVLHADAAGALLRADRDLPTYSSHRPHPAGRAICLDQAGQPRSLPMTKTFSSRLKTTVAAVAVLVAIAGPAAAFCGFYVAKADSKLFNKSSKVVLARDGSTTAITMASDYEGEPKEFAVVIPVPTFIERKQIGVVEMKTIDHLDAFTAPRLVEYHDDDPCAPRRDFRGGAFLAAAATAARVAERYKGVTVEANYDVGEYDVSILSAQESDGLVNYLNDNGYKIPAGADAVLGSYIKQKMRFFIAKVNLDRMQKLGNGYLRPLQVRYETPKFMLPIRLGTVNAKEPQDLVIYALSRNGRVETANYRTVQLPSNVNVPLLVKNDFPTFYKSMFDNAVARENMRTVFVEYAWDMGWCDPCAANPMSNKELVELGARWIASDDDRPFPSAQGANAYVTRLHVRYDANSFPEDLVLMETRDRSNFQGRYVLRHPWKGATACETGARYRDSLPQRFRDEAQNLVNLTGWPLADVLAKMEATGQPTRVR